MESSLSTFIDAITTVRRSQEQLAVNKQRFQQQVAELPCPGLRYVIYNSPDRILTEVAFEELVRRIDRLGWTALNAQT